MGKDTDVSDDVLDSLLKGDEEAPAEGGSKDKEIEPEGDEKKEPEGEPAGDGEGDDEHKKRSRMGRRLAYVENLVLGIDAKLDSLANPVKVEEEDFSSEDEEMPITRKDFNRMYEKRRNEETRSIDDYKAKYVDALTSFGRDLDEDIAEEILVELETNFDVRSSDNPKEAARINILNAENAVLRRSKGVVKRENPIKGKGTGVPSGLAGTGKIKPADAVVPELSKEAAAFAEASGMSKEDVIAALGGGSNTLKFDR